MTNLVFQPYEIRFRFVKISPVTLSRCINFLEKYSVAIVAAPLPPLILAEDLKISVQNNWGDLSKKLNLGGSEVLGGGPINPNDVMVVLKDILLCFLGLRFICIVYIS